MIRFSTESEVVQFVRDARAAAQDQITDRARADAIAGLYYLGRQWIHDQLSPYGVRTLRRLCDSSGMGANDLRMTFNRVGRTIEEVAAATYPSRLEASVVPDDRDGSAAALARASVNEAATNRAIQYLRLAGRAQAANFRRTLTGQHLVGLTVTTAPGESQGRIEAFTAPATRLVLDPFQESSDLRDHEYVIYSDVWTADKAERVYGVTLDRDKLSTVGQLTPIEQEFARLSDGSLFRHFSTYSKTPGVVVHHLHVRDDAGLFSTMLTVLEAGDREIVPNFENPETPLGGDGLPYVMLTAHANPVGPWSSSDFDWMRADQDWLNIVRTFGGRILRRASGSYWLVDKRAYPNMSEADIYKLFTNRPGAIIPWDSRGRREAAARPESVQQPAYPSEVPMLEDRAEHQIRRAGFRADGHAGVTKSHVPDSSFQRAMDEADRPLSQRVERDVEAYRTLCEVLRGTIVKHAQKLVPHTLAEMRRAGLTPDDLALLIDQDPHHPAGRVVVRESSVRYRSHAAKREDLNAALATGQMPFRSYARALARDLDTPLTEQDRRAVLWGERAVQRVLAGAPFTPMPVGPDAAEAIIEAMEAALMSDDLTPEQQQALAAAIDAQRQMMVQAMMAADPQIQMQQMQMAAQAAQPQAQEPDPLEQLSTALAGSGIAN